MFSNQVAEVSLNAPCRAVDAVRADRVESRFLVGSCSVREENHLAVLRYHSELNELVIDGNLEHPTGAVSVVASSPRDKSLCWTCAEASNEATLWRIPSSVIDRVDEPEYSPEGDTGTDTFSGFGDASLEQVAKVDHQDDGSQLVDLQWRDAGLLGDEEMSSNDPLLTLDNKGKVTMWDVSDEDVRAVRSQTVSVDGQLTTPRMAWDPHHAHECSVTAGPNVQVLDWRTDTSIPSGTVSSIRAHRYGVTDLDYNPNKPYVLATSGQDGLVKFWDLRSARNPLLVLRGGHSHYVSKVKYNPFHDQLVVSTGTDSVVNLWRVSTISSSPLLTLDEDNAENSETSAPNVRVSRYEHSDSAYGMAWGVADAWVYVSVGYDGKVVLNHVPSKEKYKILL